MAREATRRREGDGHRAGGALLRRPLEGPAAKPGRCGGCRSQCHRRRGRLCAPPGATLDEAPERANAVLPAAGAHHGPLRSAGHRADHRRVELSDPARALAADRSAVGRQLRRVEAFRGFAPLRASPWRDGAAVSRPGGRVRRARWRCRNDGAARTALGPHPLHRRHVDRPDRDDGGGEKSDAGGARTRRQESGDRRRLGRPRGRGPSHRAWTLAERRPDLHRARLRPGREASGDGIPRPPQGGGRRLLRPRPATEPRLRPRRQPPSLRPAEGTADGRHRLSRRPKRPRRSSISRLPS